MNNSLIDEAYKMTMEISKIKPNLNGYSIWTKLKVNIARYKLMLYVWFKYQKYKYNR